VSVRALSLGVHLMGPFFIAMNDEDFSRKDARLPVDCWSSFWWAAADRK
jgi:hypothetical protein